MFSLAFPSPRPRQSEQPPPHVMVIVTVDWALDSSDSPAWYPGSLLTSQSHAQVYVMVPESHC